MNKPNNFSPSDWMDKARISIMRHPEFCVLSPVMACGSVTFDEKIPTACTDGWNTRFNPAFVASLTLPELRLVVLHEAYHVAFQHLWVWRNLWEKDRTLANIAADTFINTSLMEQDAGAGFLAMPKMGIPPDPKFSGMSVGQVFDALSNQQNQQKAKQKPPQGFDAHDWEAANDHTAQQKQARDAEIGRALRQGEILQKRCKLGSGESSVIFQQLTSQVDWMEALRAFLTENCHGHDESTWARPNRKYLSVGVHMPGAIGLGAPELVVGVDTSGSCLSSAVMSRFISELDAMVATTRPARVHVISWDTQVTHHQIFGEGEFTLAGVKPRGGGGTNGACLFDYLRAKNISPRAVIQLTDGDVGSWGRSDWPTLWAVTSNRTAPYGTTLRLNA